MKSFNDTARNLQHESIDDQCKQTQGQYGDRKGQEKQDGPENSVNDAQYRRGHKSREEMVHLDTFNDLADQDQGQGIYHPPD